MAEPAPIEPEPEENKHMLDFDFQLDEPVSAASPLETLAAAEPDANSVDFDFGLDSLGAETPAVSTEGMSVSDDPLSTKLDLARVYLDMGDKDGAREVLEELVAEGEDRATVQRVWRMLENAEYKRRQAPPGVKISPRAFGRDRRYPLTNGFTSLIA